MAVVGLRGPGPGVSGEGMPRRLCEDRGCPAMQTELPDCSHLSGHPGWGECQTQRYLCLHLLFANAAVNSFTKEQLCGAIPETSEPCGFSA